MPAVIEQSVVSLSPLSLPLTTDLSCLRREGTGNGDDLFAGIHPSMF